MLTIDTAPDRVLAATASGVVDRDDVLRLTSELDHRLKDDGRTGLMIDLSGFEDITASALAKELRYELGLFGKLRRIPRVALVSEKTWVRRLAGFLDPLVPGVEMRIFATADRAAAIEWAGGFDTDEPAEPAVIQLDTPDPAFLAFDITGRLTTEDIERVAPVITAATEKHGKIDLLVRITDYQGFEPEILVQRLTLSMKLAAIGHVRRYAVVGAKDWMERLVTLFKPLTPMEIRTYAAEHEAEAWDWLSTD